MASSAAVPADAASASAASSGAAPVAAHLSNRTLPEIVPGAEHKRRGPVSAVCETLDQEAMSCPI
jgi:hypothetical protein